MDLSRAYSLMLAVCGAGLAIDALERLATLAKYHDGGLYGWPVLRQRFAPLPRRARAVVDALLRGWGRLAMVLALRLVAVAAVLSSAPYSPLYAVGLTALIGTQLFVTLRGGGFGAIGADPMGLVVCGAAWLATVATHAPAAARAGLWFVAAQSCLGYTVAGVAKLRAPQWRSGAAMTAVVSTHTYGNPRMHALLKTYPALSAALCWSVIVWETTFALVLVVPRPLVLPLLAVGLVFHAALAALMGLNLFLFAFAATYLPIWALRFG